MQNNVINLRSKNNEPKDLMSFAELEAEHGYKYSYLYKWACLKGELTVYPRGVNKLSEAEVLQFSEKRGAKYGRNKKENI